MGTLGNSLWGGATTGGAISTGVPIKPLLYMALRLAHVTQRAQIGPSTDQLADAIQQAQLMISQAQVKRAMIYSIGIAAYPLTAGKKIYTIGGPGLGADFDAPRPEKIERANVILPTGTPVHLPIFQGSYIEFSNLVVQDIPGALPRFLYCDYNMPLSNIYLVPQDQGGDQLELYTWQAIPSPVTVDDIIAYPPGYDDWFVNNLAVRLASVFADQEAYVTDDTRLEARRSAAAIQSRNTESPRLRSDAPHKSNRGDFNYFSGTIR